MPDFIKAAAITKELANVEFEAPELKWPEFDPSMAVPKALVNDIRPLLAPACSGNLGNPVHFRTDDALS